MSDTPLHKAAHEGDAHEVEQLIKEGADVNLKGASGRLAVHRALGAGHVDIAAALLKAGSSISQVDKLERNALHWAAGCTDGDAKELVELVFQYNPEAKDIDAQSDSKSTPLHFALSKGHTEAAKLLREKGADTSTIKDENGKTAVQLAKEQKIKDKEWLK